MSKMIHNYTAASTIDASADYLLIDPASSGIYKSINRNTLLALASQPLGLTDSQSPQNKTLDNTNSITVKDGSLTIQNSAGTTKQAVFSAASITAGQTRTFTFPDASGTLATIAGTQTLTNKTLTSPVISGGTIDNSTITVDSISGHTSATIVTVANLQISNGVLNTNNSVVASNITAGAVQPQALQSGTGSGWSWTSWTPTWTNLTIGNATQSASYVQTGKTVHFRLKLTLGSTTAVGTAPIFTLPVTSSATNYIQFISVIGTCSLTDTTPSAFQGICLWESTTTARLRSLNVAGNFPTPAEVTATAPIVWTTNYIIYAQGFYEAA